MQVQLGAGGAGAGENRQIEMTAVSTPKAVHSTGAQGKRILASSTHDKSEKKAQSQKPAERRISIGTSATATDDEGIKKVAAAPSSSVSSCFSPPTSQVLNSSPLSWPLFSDPSAQARQAQLQKSPQIASSTTQHQRIAAQLQDLAYVPTAGDSSSNLSSPREPTENRGSSESFLPDSRCVEAFSGSSTPQVRSPEHIVSEPVTPATHVNKPTVTSTPSTPSTV